MSGLTIGAERYAQSIRYLQRAELDQQGLVIPPDEIREAQRTAFDLRTPLPIWLARIGGISRAWDEKLGRKGYSTGDLLAGLHGQDIPLYFLIRGTPRSVQLYLGTTSAEDGAAVRALFDSQFPGGGLWPSEEPRQDATVTKAWQAMAAELQDVREFLAACGHIGVVTGLPTAKSDQSSSTETQLDRLIRGLYGLDWAYLVIATPITDSILNEVQMGLLREQLRVEQEEGMREWREQGGQSIAAMYHGMLGLHQQLLEVCLYEGGWWTQTYLCSTGQQTYQRAKALVRAVFSGDNARTDRIRVLDSSGAGLKAASFSMIRQSRSGTAGHLSIPAWETHRYETLVPSAQMSAFVHLPNVEMPGYFIRETATFDVCPHLPEAEHGIEVGDILSRGQSTNNAYRVRPEDLTKHSLVVGITGSGKTRTIFRLLQQLRGEPQPIPFLAIEPAKREYRRLARILPEGQVLRVFTVGEERSDSAPFRLNPFEIRPGVGVSTHINLLKSVFNATFGMWSPLPQVLERAIYGVYEDKGWDPVANDNTRARAADGSWHPRANPTLTDLYLKIDEIVPQLGYEREIAGNIRTALLTRINSLRVGAKGMMLDTPLSIPIENLLAASTVLELEGVGDDDEKAFIMGLLLIGIYESYQARLVPSSNSLRHVTVIEEAHRLLANVAPVNEAEASNTRGKAVETFVNMLSEIRAYGEGFLIAEQIPTKLAPEVIKNTALKVVHRLVANDDRVVVGGSMNLSTTQLRQLVALAPGQAVVHGGGKFGDDNAMLIQVPLVEERPGGDLDNIRALWNQFCESEDLSQLFRSYPTCRTVCGPESLSCVGARQIAERPSVANAASRIVLGLVAASMSRSEAALAQLAYEIFPEMTQEIRSQVTGIERDEAYDLCVVTHALYRLLKHCAAEHGWSYGEVTYFLQLLLPVCADLIAGRNEPLGHGSLLGEFCRTYRASSLRRFAPFVFCDRVCGDPPTCLYRDATASLLDDEEIVADFVYAGIDPAQVARACELAGRQVLAKPNGEPTEADQWALRRAAMCFLIQKTSDNPSQWPTGNRSLLIGSVLEHYGQSVARTIDEEKPAIP